MNHLFKNNISATSGDLTAGPAAGTLTPGATLNMVAARVDPVTLSARVVVDAETNTITLAAVWEVSRDGVTWVRCSPATNNAAEVVLATGTAGADASVTRQIPAPPMVAAFRYCRCSILNGVTTGAAADTWAISYDYKEID